MTRQFPWLTAAALALAGITGCAGGKEQTAETDDASTAAPATGTSSTGPTTAAPDETTTPSAPTSTGPEATTADIVETTGPALDMMPAAGECEPIQQDCPEGQKCTAVAKAEGTPWDYNTCVPVQGEGVAGDPCDVQDNKYSGFDNCGKGLLCMFTDQAGMGGICIEFCDVAMSCPMTGAACEIYNEGVLPICLPACDPLIQDCPEGQACYQGAAGFACFKNVAPPDKGGQGSECKSVNICQGGYHCADAALLPDCAGEGCCTAFCAVSEGDANCPDGLMCLPFFAEDEPPPEYADVGICSIMQ